MSSDLDHSITHCIEALKERGDENAAEQLYDRYIGQLLELARKELNKRPVTKRHVDPEDVVQSVFDTLFRRAKDGKFPKLKDRDNLWPLLLRITEYKASKAARRLLADKRRLDKVRGESALVGPDGEQRGIDDIAAATEPTPEFAGQFVAEIDRLMNELHDDRQRRVAGLKMEGYTNKEIAEKVGCAERTVKSVLAKIREIWVAERP